MSPLRISRNLKESDEAAALMQWAAYHSIASEYLIAIPNGGTRNVREAKNLKRQGVKPGVSDYFLAYPYGAFHGLWIELKRPKPYRCVVSPQQLDWISKMQNRGYGAEICYGANEAIAVIKNYLT